MSDGGGAALLTVDRPADGVATVTLQRTERRNALSIALRDQISDALDALAADEAIRVVVITGAGPVFCAGFDLAEFQVADPEFQSQLWASSDRYHQTVARFPLPTIAAINGPAIAGGFDLAVLCDLRIAATTARFAHPERLFGDVVYGPLHDLVGGALARELCLTGKVLTASEAQATGLVSAVVEPDELAAAALAMAIDVAQVPRAVLLRTKAKILRRAGIDPDSATLAL
jgi:enoyl-CoA hydratase/carnithine racemase